ncbi:MAG: putative toxin-antitoxin system toxin component, PIN family [Nitrospiria bacterium]
MKIVLDANVFLSGLILPESVPGNILQAWREARFDLVLSEAMLEEIGRVLSYPKIRKRLKWNDQQIERFLLLLKFKSLIVDPAIQQFKDLRDQADAPILAALVESQAEALVTGDKDLLVLADRYPIFTPAEFSLRL